MCWYHLSKNIYIFKAKNEQQETLQAGKELKQEAKQKKRRIKQRKSAQMGL